MSAFDNYGEDIGGQSYSSYADTPGDAGGGDEGPRTPIDPTKGFDIPPPPSERLSLLDRIKDLGGDVLGGITSLALGLTPQSLMASQFLPTLFSSVRDRFFPTYKTGINTIELDDRFTMPRNKPGITRINIPNFPPDMDLYATRPTSGYEDPDRAKEKDDALEQFYKDNPQFRPPEQSGINQLEFIV
tara:strand:+ start:117 stop:677 length:561 start_codon:yes stop_codon:yes gene_type:complete